LRLAFQRRRDFFLGQTQRAEFALPRLHRLLAIAKLEARFFLDLIAVRVLGRLDLEGMHEVQVALRGIVAATVAALAGLAGGQDDADSRLGARFDHVEFVLSVLHDLRTGERLGGEGLDEREDCGVVAALVRILICHDRVFLIWRVVDLRGLSLDYSTLL